MLPALLELIFMCLEVEQSHKIAHVHQTHVRMHVALLPMILREWMRVRR